MLNAKARFDLIQANEQLVNLDLNNHVILNENLGRSEDFKDDQKSPFFVSTFDFNKNTKFENPVSIIQKYFK